MSYSPTLFAPPDAGPRHPSRIMGTGLMPDLVRVFDWSSTPLGPIESWSDTLISTVNQVLFSATPATLCWGPELTLIYNEAAIPALQGKHPHALGSPYREVYSEVWHLVGADLEACLQQGVTRVGRDMLIPLLNNGKLEEGYFSYYLIPVFENGTVVGIYNPYQNTTEAVLTARKLDAVAASLTQVLNATTDAVVSIDRDWQISYMNPAATRAYSQGRDLVGKNLWEEFPQALYPDSPIVEHYTRAMDLGIPGSFETRFPEPLDIWIQLEVYPTPDGIVTFSRDITAAKSTQAALLLTEKLAAVGKMASTIAHEINNPLEAVTNLLYIARHSKDLIDIYASLDVADEELRRVAIIANQTLRFHKPNSQPVTVPSAELLRSVISTFERKIKNAGVTVESRTRATGSIHIAEGDIRQVFNNLVGNAIDATPRGGRLLIRSRDAVHPKTGQPGQFLTVADTGTGMPPEVLERAFEPFYSTKATLGTGLGLWITKDIVNRHHGILRVRTCTTAPNRGTAITLFLPSAPPHHQPAPTRP